MKTFESATNDIDKQGLLKKAALVDVLDGWREGILTIGTLGFVPLESSDQRKEYIILQSEKEDEKAEEEQYSLDGGDHDTNENIVDHEELNPLILPTFEPSFGDFESSQKHDNVRKPAVAINVVGASLTPCVGPPKLNAESDKKEGEQKKKKGERITLADLFLADADVKGKLDPREIPCSGEKPLLRTKSSRSFAKKFIPYVKEDSRPVQNLQRVSIVLSLLLVIFPSHKLLVTLSPLVFTQCVL